MDQVACRPEHEASAVRDLAALGLTHDGDVVRQSERLELYRAAIERLIVEDLTYPCYCTRREVLAEAAESVSAPHGARPTGAYPGTCRTLDRAGRQEREAAGRTPSLRLRSEGSVVSFTDRLAGDFEGVVDDFVIRRVDGTPAYNLAVVIDDASQGIGEVVRGDDLLETTPRQIHLARLLGVPGLTYLHVPLVFGPDGERLAKRHGAVTLDDQQAMGRTPADVRDAFAVSLGLAEEGEKPSLDELVQRFDAGQLPRNVWVLPQELSGSVEP
jgi:glutamyl-tRNA synthetase